MISVLIDIVSFLLFMIIQSFVINGIFECFQGGCVQEMNKGKICQGNIFYMINPGFFEKAKGKIWAKPLFSCVRCMSSVYGTLTYWPIVIMIFGFHWQEIVVYFFDLFSLVYLNYYFYKKI